MQQGIVNNTFYYQQDHRVPMTTISLVFHGAGEQQEGETNAGLGRIVAKMIFRGTSTMSREAIHRKLDILGADVSASVTETDFVLRISCLSQHLRDVLTFIRSILLEVNFPESELAIVQKEEENAIQAVLQDPETVLRTAHLYVLYDGLRYGKIGSLKAIRSINRGQVLSFYEKIRTCKVLYIAVITDLLRGEIEQLCSIFSKDRPTDGFALQPEEEFRDSHGIETTIVHSEDASNDRLMWSHRGVTATDERRFALNLIIDALGSFEGFLFDQLRNKNGWCYGAYALFLAATTRRGRIGYYADPSGLTSEKLIPALYHHIGTFFREVDFIDRLKDRNNTFKNRYAYKLDLNYKLMSEIHRDSYGIPILDREAYYAKIDAVTLETAQQTISEVFDIKNISMVFYGDSERISNIIRSFLPDSSIRILQKEVLVS